MDGCPRSRSLHYGGVHTAVASCSCPRTIAGRLGEALCGLLPLPSCIFLPTSTPGIMGASQDNAYALFATLGHILVCSLNSLLRCVTACACRSNALRLPPVQGSRDVYMPLSASSAFFLPLYVQKETHSLFSACPFLSSFSRLFISLGFSLYHYIKNRKWICPRFYAYDFPVGFSCYHYIKNRRWICPRFYAFDFSVGFSCYHYIRFRKWICPHFYS